MANCPWLLSVHEFELNYAGKVIGLGRSLHEGFKNFNWQEVPHVRSRYVVYVPPGSKD